MTESCVICETELGCTDPTGWEYSKKYPHEVVCPWCIKEGKYI